MNKPIIYIAGPISGQPDLNREAFYEAQEQINALGFESLNPHEFCKDIQSQDPQDHKYYRRGFEALAKATDIILLDGWQYSAGAQLESKAAVLFKMGIFENIEDLKRKYSNPDSE